MLHTPPLQLLGRPRLAIASPGGADVLPEKAYVLAALLLLGPAGPTSRNILTTRLWEDASHAKALNNMRQLIARTRHFETQLDRPLFDVSRTAKRRTAAGRAAYRNGGYVRSVAACC